MSVGRPRWTSPPTSSIVCWTWDARAMSASPDPDRVGVSATAPMIRAPRCYNHNLDTSPEFYGDIITTRTYQDRLDTLEHVRAAGIHVCCGGIVGMGESREDRIGLIHTLATLPKHPESVPINLLVQVEGTPLAGTGALEPFEFVRTVAAARIAMPGSWVRLSAGREAMSEEMQA